jgi:hypothetical protein
LADSSDLVELATIHVGVQRVCRKSAPGRDLDDAVGGGRPVQRGGSRTFDDLDVLDLGRVQVVEPRGVLTADVDRAATGIGVGPHAVDDDDGLVGERDGIGTADADARTAARCATDLRHDDAWRADDSRSLTLLMTVLNGVGVDRRDGVAGLLRRSDSPVAATTTSSSRARCPEA